MSPGLSVDSSMFIDHLRARDKANTLLAIQLRRHSQLFISTVVEYEVEVGITALHRKLWDSIRECLTVLPFDSEMVLTACQIKHRLKAKGKQIELADLFIAATAMASGLPLATLNRKHFELIDRLELL